MSLRESFFIDTGSAAALSDVTSDILVNRYKQTQTGKQVNKCYYSNRNTLTTRHRMTPMIILLVTLALVMVNNQRSFVDTAPVLPALTGSPEVVPQYQDDNVVRDLENLKNTLGKSMEMMKMHSEVYTNINGHKEAHSNTKEQLNENGKMVAKLGQKLDTLPGPDGNPLAKLLTKVDIPSKGIHKTLEENLDAQQTPEETQNGNRRAPNLEISNSDNLERDGSYSGIQYTPLDMAEYVFWTGDEKGVTLAIEEFLQEGLMSREEAISFLQEIKYNLDYLQKHYTEVGLNTRERAREKESTPNGLFYNMRDTNNKNSPKPNPYVTNQVVADKKNTASWSNFLKEQTKFDQGKAIKQKEQYDALLERLRVADFLYTEYSLEEVIYQLAKVMFTQSLTRGSLDAQQSLQKFTTFLENEAEQGRISRALEKKVLDVLIASLTDTLGEHPELTAVNNQDPNLSEASSRENLMKQLLILNNNEHKIMEDILSPNYTNELKRNAVNSISNQIKNNEKKLSLDIEKYKHP